MGGGHNPSQGTSCQTTTMLILGRTPREGSRNQETPSMRQSSGPSELTESPGNMGSRQGHGQPHPQRPEHVLPGLREATGGASKDCCGPGRAESSGVGRRTPCPLRQLLTSTARPADSRGPCRAGGIAGGAAGSQTLTTTVREAEEPFPVVRRPGSGSSPLSDGHFSGQVNRRAGA